MTLRKRTWRFLWAGVLGLLGPAAAMSTIASAQTIVVTARSVKDLAGDFEYLIKAAAPEGVDVQAAIDGLKQLQAGDLVKGLDQNRGFALAVTLPKDFPAGGPPTAVIAVPVTDLGQFLESLQNLGLAVDNNPGIPGFSHKLSGPNDNPTLFVTQAKGYALFTPIPDGADKLKDLDPASWKAKSGRPGALISARVQLSEIPQMLKDQFLAGVEGQAQQNERRPGESEPQFRGRIAGQNLAVEAFRSLARDGDALALELDLDRQAAELGLELTLSARPGSPMAKSLRSLQERRSRFQSLAGDASLSFWASFPLAKDLREGFSQGLDPLAKGEVPGLTTPEQKKLFQRFIELMKANLAAPDLDYGVMFGRPTSAGGRAPHFSMVFGMKVQNGREVETLVRDALKEVKPEKGAKVEFEVAKAADGTAIHRLSGPIDEKDRTDANIAKIFGKGTSLAFAFRDDAILAAFGEDSVKALQSAVQSLSSPRPAANGAGEPVAIVARLADFGVFADDDDERAKYQQAAAVAFKDAAKRDRVSMVVKGRGDEVHLRLSVDVPALKFLATVGQSMQK